VLKLFNTATHQEEEFRSIVAKEVGMYCCGPTVYNFAHIGNLSAYLFNDFLKRYLTYLGYNVNDVMNFTDVDDKTIKGSQVAKIPLAEFTKKFEVAILDDFKKLNIKEPRTISKATDHIKEMQELIKTLIDKGHAYQAEDGCVYFKIASFPEYGVFAGINKRELKVGACGRVNTDEYSKGNACDFVLWKAWDEADGDVFWDSPWGKGRPGWHIECSAMSIKELGPTFDIHTGGVDLIFPHHQNEIAQSEGATGQKFVNYWLHRNFLKVNDTKMSKSLGNFYVLSDILQKVPDPMAFRYFILTNHYRQPLNFTFEALKSAETSLNKIHNFVTRLQNTVSVDETSNEAVDKAIDEARQTFKNSLDNDLNSPLAIASLFEFMGKINKLIDEEKIGDQSKENILKVLKEIDAVWGFIFSEVSKIELTREQKTQIETLVKERESYRQNKEWAKADGIKKQLADLGVIVTDTSKETSWTIL